MKRITGNGQGVFEEAALFLEYSVPEDEREEAKKYLESCRCSPFHLNLCLHYYKSLPEAREEALLKVVLVDIFQGYYLLGLKTSGHEYLYCADRDQVVYLGEYGSPIEDEELWHFFGYASVDEFCSSRKDFSEYPLFPPVQEQDVSHCLVCLAEEGESHEFGCPVEICPWCDGQLNRCGCRFEKLGVEEIRDEDLDSLLQLLEKKGRIPFVKGEGVSYPVAGDDTLEKEKR